jgi:hypothetical protein
VVVVDNKDLFRYDCSFVDVFRIQGSGRRRTGFKGSKRFKSEGLGLRI